ncbi:serine/threonine protein kinase [Terrimicrobium sacchariphilum]|uniref:Serine/threonine protein kinase n=1 Tax=Terrimicrobium sacchariphilum TaxID=690879 RepID=A0A146G2G6_TERSA|nr:protein kinase [Terrimicrobium sacchariphilum]GAT32025.1 serine/threonine protein kinase [Terrimicrobium sacchariphilum]
MSDPVRFQHFEVLRREDGSLFELGRGAMGITYKAFDTNLRCFVALKVINGTYLNSDIARQRFLREARAAAALRHPNVATVFHLGDEEDNYFYAMEFIDGETVEAFMKREGAVPPVMALEIALQVCRALTAAEKQGLVHRDIKPANLMLIWEDDTEFTVKVIDFGLAKNSSKEDGEDAATLTAGGFLGTPHFASPEQLDEREIDIRSDIYSLGVTLWYMLAGKTPFSGSLAQVMSQHLHRDPPFQSLDGQIPSVVGLLKHMMAKAPEDRPATPAALRKEIEECLAALRQSGASTAPATSADAESFETVVLPEPIAEAETLASGQMLAGRFRLIAETVASDHGRLFKADSLEDGKTVAVLILHSEKFATSQAFTQLEQEIETLQRLRAPALQKILSLERTDYHSFIVLEWVDGPTLLDLLRTRRLLPVPEAVRLLAPLAEAFDNIAEAGLNCPDIAAHEVTLTGGEVDTPVTGWTTCHPRFLGLSQAGASNLPADATMVATSYALMKAAGAFAANPRNAFVYAVATLAFEMLGGVRGGSSIGTFVPIAGLSEDGNNALRQALDPAKGFATAAEFVTRLSEARSTAAVPSAPVIAPAIPSPAPSVEPATAATIPGRKKTSPILILGVSGGVLVILAILGVLLSARKGAPAEKPVEPVVASATPTPTPVPATPTPIPVNQPYLDDMARADALLHEGNFPGALAAYTRVAVNYPDEKKPLDQLELVSASLRARKIPASQVASLRGPLETAAELKVRSAQMALGEMLRVSDPSAALKWFIAAADQGQTEAMVYAGQMQASGQGVSAPDFVSAAKWFTKAADGQDADGMYFLAECYLSPDSSKGVLRDPQKAFVLLSTAATVRNHTRAMNLLGDIYTKGIPNVVERDYAKAFDFFSKASAGGLLDAQGNLGVLYINGQGVEKDPAKAAALFKEGAEQKNPLCMYFYAMCLDGGFGVEKNASEAREMYRAAARLGNAKALDWCRSKGVSLE